MTRAGTTAAPSIDLHTHVLPGVDDGPATLVESLALARELSAAGVRIAAATPHVSTRYPNTPDGIAAALEGVRQGLARTGIELEVIAGAEVAVDQLAVLDDRSLRALTLGGRGTCLLVEFPYEDWPGSLADALAALARGGVAPLLAHPERNPLVQAAPQRLAGLVDAGALVQVTAGSLTGAFGANAARAAQSLVETELAHVVASDLHETGTRPTVAAARERLPEPLAAWLMWDVPNAILHGDMPPPRPRLRRRRRARLF